MEDLPTDLPRDLVFFNPPQIKYCIGGNVWGLIFGAVLLLGLSDDFSTYDNLTQYIMYTWTYM